jgi:hypothetical protein
LLRRVSLGAFALFFAVDTHPARQDNTRKLDRAPHRELRRPVEHLAATRNQLRAQHQVRKPVQRLDWNFAAVSYPMKQCSGGPMDIVHWHNGFFILDTVSEMGRFGAFDGFF